MAEESQETKIAVLQMQIKGIEKKVDDGFHAIGQQLTDLTKSIEDRNAVVDARFVNKEEFGNKIIEIEKKLGSTWLNYTATAILSVVLTGMVSLIVYFLTHK